jgi:signal transduction histidine kinase
MRFLRERAAPLALLLIATLLPLVAVLQYRWLGSLSELEGQRMERTLRAATDRFADDFDDDLTDIYQEFHLDRGRGEEATVTEFVDEYTDWRESASSPEMVAEVYWVSGSSATGLQVRRFDPVALAFEESEWPAWLIAHREAMARDLDDYQDRRDRRRPQVDPLHPDIPALLIFQDEVSPRAYAAVRLDRDFLVGELIPARVRETITLERDPNLAQSLAAGGATDYDVLIVNRERPDQVVYASRADLQVADLAEPDWEEDLFGLEGGGAGSRERWRVLVQHRAGSLEAAVTAARLRSVAISFGALLLLAGSMLMLLVSTRRAQSLAVQQMDFVAGVSHELRTPLAGISSLSQNLADGVVRDERKIEEYGRAIHRETARLNDMVETVLLFSKVQSGVAQYERRPVSLEAIVNDVLRALQNVPSLHVGDVVTKLPDDLPDVHVDESATKAAVRNVIVNALKFNRDRQPVVVAAREARNGERRCVRLAVADRSGGIDPDELSRVMEPFYRGRAARDRQVEGSGLGLSIVKQVVEGQGGKVTIESVAGEGTTVTLSLPVTAGRRPPVSGDDERAAAGGAQENA